jgi:hypothetical protein
LKYRTYSKLARLNVRHGLDEHPIHRPGYTPGVVRVSETQYAYITITLYRHKKNPSQMVECDGHYVC